MKVVILAGGLGTRLSEETESRPKPMVEIAGRPILWHIMQSYAAQGFTDFLVALGYKGDQIRAYASTLPAWNTHAVDTGLDTPTGGRLHALRSDLPERFMLTYGDGVADVDLQEVLDHHRQHGKVATLTAVRPPARFGTLSLEGGLVRRFSEKSPLDAGWINGGFMVFEPTVFQYLDATCGLEHVLERLAEAGQLAAYQHEGFWQCMDTLREKRLLESLWCTGNAPWLGGRNDLLA